MNGQRLWRAALISVLSLLGPAVSVAPAQEAPAPANNVAPGLADVRHIYVPANEPDLWPPGDWLPIPAEDYRALRRTSLSEAPSPPRAFLERMVYRARLSGHSLRGGILEGVARLRSEQPRFVSLGAPTLAMHDLRWPNSDALWGSAADGQTLLRVEGDREPLRGRWSLAGRPVFDDVEFEVSVPPAVVSQFEIEIPGSSQLLLDGGLVSRVSPSESPGWTIWSIDLGHRTSCRMTVVSGGQETPSPADHVQASQAVQYSLRLDGLHLLADVTIEQSGGPVASLDFLVPSEMQFFPVTVGGETVLPAQSRKDGSAHLLSVNVRGLDLSPGTTIRLRGKMPLERSGQLDLPRLDLRAAQWLRTRRSVAVARPLELSDIRTEGCQLLGSSVNSDGGDVLEYEDYSHSSRITVIVDDPRPGVSATVVSHADWRGDDPLMRSTLLLRALSGATFVVRCRVPAEWEVTKLESDAATPVAQWRHSPHAVSAGGDDGRLFIEFRKALTPQLPAEVVVWCRHVGSTTAESVDVPVVVPEVSGDREVCLVVAPPDAVGFDVESDSAYQRVSLSSLLEEWGALLPDELSNIDEDKLLVLRGDEPPPGQRLRVVPQSDTAARTPQSPAEGAPHHQDRSEAVKVSLPSRSAMTWRSGIRKNSEILRTSVGTLASSATKIYSRSPSFPVPESASGTTEVVAGTVRSLSATLTVQTTVAIDRGRLCRNRAIFDLPPTSVNRELTFHLPRPVRLIAARMVESPSDPRDRPLRTDGRNVRLTLGPSPDPRQVEILYESPAQQSVISGSAQIPLPEWNGRTSTIAWEILLPREYRLATSTDGTSAQLPAGCSWSQRLLGPLGRSSNEPPLWPWSAKSWRHLVAVDSEPQPVTTGVGQEQRIRRSLSGAETALSLSFWSATRAKQVGWVTLALGLFLTAWPHRYQRLFSTHWSWGITLCGLIAALLAPGPLAIPCGGFVIGTILGSLIPEEWRVRPTRRPPRAEPMTQRTTTTTRVVPRLQATGACLLVWLAAGSRMLPAWQSVGPRDEGDSVSFSRGESSGQRLDVLVPLDPEADPIDQPPRIVYLKREQVQAWSRHLEALNPAFLIRSAEYEIRGFETSHPRVAARFDAILLRPDDARHVTLPLTGAIFPDANACHVNGVPSTLLPHRSGRGVVIDVSAALDARRDEPAADGPAPDPARKTESASPPQQVRIDLDFRPRRSAQQRVPRLHLGIPTVLDSRAIFRVGSPAAPAIDVAHRGASRPPGADGLWHVALGGLAELVAHPAGEGLGRRWLEPRSAVSMVETHLLRHQVASRLVFDVEREALALSSRTLVLRLPPQSIVHDVRSAGLERTRFWTDSGGQVQLHLTFPEVAAAGLAVELEFDLPISSPGSAGDVTLPALPFLTGEPSMTFPVHSVGISASPGFEITATHSDEGLAESGELLSGLATEWLGARRIRNPDVVHTLESPRPLVVPLSFIEPDVDVSTSQILTVLESRVDWTARLDVTVRDAAVPAHRIAIDPRLRIRQINARQEGVERLANWSQTKPDELLLLLTEQFTGNQTLEFHGTLALTDRREFAVPSIVLFGATRADAPSVVVRSPNELSVEVLRGTNVMTGPSNPPTSADNSQFNEIGPFRADETSAPIVVRIIESTGSEWNLDQVTVIRPVSDDSIEHLSTLRVTADGGRPTSVDVRVSSLPPEFEVNSSLPAAEQTREPGGDVTLHWELPQPLPPAWTLTVLHRRDARFPSSWSLPSFALRDGSIGRRFVVAANAAAIDLPNQDGRLVSPVELPQWVPERESFTTADWTVWELEGEGAPVEVTHNGDVAASVRMLDSAVWQLADGSWRGVTVADVVAHRDVSVPFAIPDGLSVDSAALEGTGTAELTERAVRFDLTKQTAPRRCTLWWHRAERPGSGSEIPLPRPVDIEYSHFDVLVLGRPEQYYVLGGRAVLGERVDLLRDLDAADERAGMRSPIAQALRAAGVRPFSESSVATETNRWGLMSIRLPDSATALEVHAIDRQIVHVTILIFVAFVLVMGWLVLGRWIDVGRLRQGVLAPSSIGLLSMGTVIWLWGSGLAGLLLMLAGGWRLLHDVRHSRSKTADSPSSPEFVVG